MEDLYLSEEPVPVEMIHEVVLYLLIQECQEADPVPAVLSRHDGQRLQEQGSLAMLGCSRQVSPRPQSETQ